MRIAQVSPLIESVPPKLYGGTERIVSYLTDALVSDGHDVTLYASGDSSTLARLRPVCPRALRFDPSQPRPTPYHLLAIEKVMAEADDYDIIHFHHDFLHFPLARRHPIPSVTTLHGRLNIPDVMPLYHEFTDVPLVSISDAQREPVPWMNWQQTIYHGVPDSHLPYDPDGGDHVVFLGRMTPEKRPDLAIRIAREAGLRIRLAAKIDPVDQEWFDTVVKPMLDDPGVEFVGEITESEKGEFLGGALAMLFPIDWPEPFGLVMIESMACGTPVIAFRAGSVPEVIDEGVTGFIVEDVPSAVAAVKRVAELDRRAIRDVFDRRFSVRRMTSDYVELYEHLMATQQNHSGAREHIPAAAGPLPTMTSTVSSVIKQAMSQVNREAPPGVSVQPSGHGRRASNPQTEELESEDQT